MACFLGVDLGWYGKPTGLARLENGVLTELTRLEERGEILQWIGERAGRGAAVVAVDAPLVIPNASGTRDAERALNRDYRRFDAGCHAANQSLPFAGRVTSFARALEQAGFRHGARMRAGAKGRYQIEVHPHAATVEWFGLERIVKYKRGRREERARGLGELRRLMLAHLPAKMELPEVPERGALKPVEDQLDAVICAHIAWHWWQWGNAGSRVYGTNAAGYIVVPRRYP